MSGLSLEGLESSIESIGERIDGIGTSFANVLEDNGIESITDVFSMTNNGIDNALISMGVTGSIDRTAVKGTVAVMGGMWAMMQLDSALANNPIYSVGLPMALVAAGIAYMSGINPVDTITNLLDQNNESEGLEVATVNVVDPAITNGGLNG